MRQSPVVQSMIGFNDRVAIRRIQTLEHEQSLVPASPAAIATAMQIILLGYLEAVSRLCGLLPGQDSHEGLDVAEINPSQYPVKILVAQ